MSDVVLHPAFSADELAKFKQTEGATLEQRLSNPTFLAQQAFKRVIYGDTPMAIASASKESIEKISVDHLKQFHDKHYVPGNSILGITGDFKAAAMQSLIEKYFGGWTGAAEAPDEISGDGSAAAHQNHPGRSSRLGADRYFRRRPNHSAHQPGILRTGRHESSHWRRTAVAALSRSARGAQPDLRSLQPFQRRHIPRRLAGLLAGAHPGDRRSDGSVHLRIQENQQRADAAKPNSTTLIARSSRISRYRSNSRRRLSTTG